MEYITVTLDGLNDTWSSGSSIIDVLVQLGQNEKSSNTEITLADPYHAIAAKLIDHSLKTGGITTLESDVQPVQDFKSVVLDETTAATPKTPEEWEVAIVQGCVKYGVSDPLQIAYILATAWKETTMGADLVNEGAIFEGRADLGNTTPGDGRKYVPRGLVQVTGKLNYGRVSRLVGADLINSPTLLEKARYAVPAIVLGMKQGTFTGKKLSDYIGNGKADLYNARRIVNSTESAELIANKAKNTYLPKVNKLLQQANASTANIAGKPEVLNITPNATDTAAQTQPVKGNKLTVNILDRSFEFYHQGTELTSDGKTKVTGQGIRWVMNRRKRNKTEKNIRLSDLAAKVAKAHKLKLVYDASVDLTYEFIDQTNITDYALLKRECDRAGLFIGEANGQLTIKSLHNLSDPKFDIILGYNLISYTIKDAAIDTYAEDKSSALLQQEPKIELNPVTGKFEQKRIDIDKVKDASSTGKDKANVAGTFKPGQEALANASKARTMRVQGLPSTFVLPMDTDSLALTPLMVVRTKGLPETLSRIWVIDSVKHAVAAGTTTINCYSPIEVIAPANSQPLTQGTTAMVTTSAELNPTGYIWGAHGIQGDSVGINSARSGLWRGKTRHHNGTDIAAPMNTPVVASKDGVVVRVTFQAGGAGKFIVIKHPDGIETTYMHLNTQDVSVGTQVKQGQRIGLMGSTGGSTGSHLHQEFRKNGAVLLPESVGLSWARGARV